MANHQATLNLIKYGDDLKAAIQHGIATNTVMSKANVDEIKKTLAEFWEAIPAGAARRGRAQCRTFLKSECDWDSYDDDIRKWEFGHAAALPSRENLMNMFVAPDALKKDNERKKKKKRGSF